MQSRKKTAAAIMAAGAAVLLLAGCAGGKASVEGTWGTGGEGEPQLVLSGDGSLSGTDGCNQLAGSWEEAGDGEVDFGDVASTLMACEGVDTWLSGLSSGVVDGDTLRILDADGDEIGALAKSTKG